MVIIVRGSFDQLDVKVTVMILLTWFEWSASFEGIAGHVFGAGADGGETSEFAVGADAAGALARALADAVEAGGFVAGAVDVSVAFGLAGGVGVSEVVLKTRDSN